MQRRGMFLRGVAAVAVSWSILGPCGPTRAGNTVTIEPDLVYGHKDGLALTCDVYRPAEGANGAAVLFMVSGGWFSGWRPPEEALPLFAPFTDRGFTVIAVRHGSSPRYGITDAVADVRRCVRFVRHRAERLGIDPGRLGVYGMSAGGHLSLMLGTTADEGDPRADDPVLRMSDRVQAVCAWVAPTDLRPVAWSDPDHDPQYDGFPALDMPQDVAAAMSPLLAASADDAPTLLVAGAQDELVPIWHSRKMHEALEAQGVKVKLVAFDKAGHGFGGEDLARAFAETAAWFEAHLVPAAAAADTSDSGPVRRRVPPANGLPPEEAARAMTVPAGFEVRLLAAEPDVRQPIAMAFDDRGRLWVAEAYAYPVRVPEAEARDRILIFEDTDGDHVLDSRKVFVEGLNLVSGLEVGFGGVWVGAAPHLLFIPDRDGDDVPDGPPEVLLDGWGWQDTHETLNGFIWGPDGWLYGCHGVFTHSAVGRPGTPDDERTRINAGIWRYHPVRHRFEVFAHGTSNPWGVDFNDVGQAFATACVIPHLYHVIRGARYQRQAGQHFDPWTFDDIKTIARHRHWTGGQWNNADREASDAVGGGHAHSGACVYLGGAWPDRYRGRLFMNNIHGARLNQDRLEPEGSGYVGDGDPDFLFANDTSSQFINLRYGPDGQMVLIDWYDANQCHATEIGRHDRSNGRIFKVLYTGDDPARAAAVRVDLRGETDTALVGMLAHDNDWFGRHARRLLQERAAAGRLDSAVYGILRGRLAAAPTAEARLRYLWALHVTGLLTPDDLQRLLADPDPFVRAWVVELAGDRDDIPPSEFARHAAMLAERDPSPVVRLAVASGLQRLPAEHRWEAAAALVAHEEDAADHNLPLMDWYAVEPLVPLDPARALALAIPGDRSGATRGDVSGAARGDVSGAARGGCIPLVARFIVRRAAAIDAAYEPLVARLAAAGSATRRWMLEEIVAAVVARGRMPMPQAWQTGYDALRTDPDPEVRRLADVAAVRFGDERVLPAVRGTLADRGEPAARRTEALEALVAVKDPALPPVLHGLLDDAAVDRAALAALGAVPHDDTPAVVLTAYPSLSAAARPAAVATLVSRPAWTVALLDAIDAGRVPRDDLSAFTVGRLADSADPRVLARLNEVWGTIRTTPDDRRAEMEAWKQKLGPKQLGKADLAHGREVYARTCGSCHVLHGVGGRIGPELTGSNRGDLDYLLANLLDPSAVVGRDYQMTTIVTTDGRSLAGIVVRESPEAVTLQTPTEQVVVPTGDIDVRALSPLSLMPENQLAQLDPASARDLVAYLRHPTQVPLPGEGPPAFTAAGTIPGAIEGETLPVREKTGGTVRPQPMGGFSDGRWSGASQLWWTGARPGDRLELEVPVSVAGRHDVRVVCTRAHDYGIVRLRWADGSPAPPLDLYEPGRVVLTPETSLGVHDLAAGTATLTVEITGANPAATPAWMFGLDYVRLVPVADR